MTEYYLWKIRYTDVRRDMQTMWHDDEQVARVHRADGTWAVLPAGQSKFISGFKTRQACAEFMLEHVLRGPWYDDPTNQQHMEYSRDGVTWSSEADEPLYMRWVAHGLTMRREPA